MFKNYSSIPWPCIEYLWKTNISIELVNGSYFFHLKNIFDTINKTRMDIEYEYKLWNEYSFNFYLTNCLYIFFTAVIWKVFDDAIHRYINWDSTCKYFEVNNIIYTWMNGCKIKDWICGKISRHATRKIWQ